MATFEIVERKGYINTKCIRAKNIVSYNCIILIALRHNYCLTEVNRGS